MHETSETNSQIGGSRSPISHDGWVEILSSPSPQVHQIPRLKVQNRSEPLEVHWRSEDTEQEQLPRPNMTSSNAAKACVDKQ